MFVFSQTQVSPLCSSDDQCNIYSTRNTQICDRTGTDPICKPRTLKAFGTTNTDVSTGMCTASLYDGNFARFKCVQLSGPGCAVADANLEYTVCVGSNYNSTTKSCVESTSTSTTVGIGERCNVLGFSPSCQENAVCLQKVCREKLNQGDNCYNSPIPCKNGLTCDGDLCVPITSKRAYQPCKSGSACGSLTCINGACLNTRDIPCYSNADCSASQNCLTSALGQRGFCLNSENLVPALQRCYTDKCQNLKTTDECISNCEKEYVRYQCLVNCPRREDLRWSNSDAYIYDCSALTRTKQTNVCGYRTVYSNCPSSLSN